jgi:hypothetical protein
MLEYYSILLRIAPGSDNFCVRTAYTLLSLDLLLLPAGVFGCERGVGYESSLSVISLSPP